MNVHPRFPELLVICGPMYSGKTSRMQYIIQEKIRDGKTCVVVCHKGDELRQQEEFGICAILDQTTNNICKQACHTISHLGKQHVTHFIESFTAFAATDAYKSADVIAIDEAQFFDQVDFKTFIVCARVRDRKDIIVCGLHNDKDMVPFLDHNFLFSAGAHYEQLHAICGVDGCCDRAFQTISTKERASRVSPGVEGYMPVCDFHNDEHHKQERLCISYQDMK